VAALIFRWLAIHSSDAFRNSSVLFWQQEVLDMALGVKFLPSLHDPDDFPNECFMEWKIYRGKIIAATQFQIPNSKFQI